MVFKLEMHTIKAPFSNTTGVGSATVEKSVGSEKNEHFIGSNQHSISTSPLAEWNLNYNIYGTLWEHYKLSEWKMV